jgi:hypothetical protein
VVELFAVRLIHHLIAECKSLHPVPPVTRPRVPHASKVERAFTGTFTRIAPLRSFHPFPLDGIFTRFAPLRPTIFTLQTVGLSLSPCFCQQWHWIESSDYSPLKRLTYKVSRISVGLLDEASIEHGQALLRASGSTSRHLGGWLIPPPFAWLVARLLRLMPSIRITSVERFYVTDNHDRKTTVTDLIPQISTVNQRFGNSVLNRSVCVQGPGAIPRE